MLALADERAGAEGIAMQGNAPGLLIFLPIALLFAGCTPSAAMPANAGPAYVAADAGRPATRQALLYVSEPNAGAVAVYTYPQLSPHGALTGLNNPEGLCVDARNGNLWVVSGPFAPGFTEFAHGGTKPIRKIRFGASGDYTQACAVDPTTGNLAITDNHAHAVLGDIVVFGAKEKAYLDNRVQHYNFVAYDDAGNLFFDGEGGGTLSTLVGELPAGKRHFVLFPLHVKNAFPTGGVQYDGTYLALGREQRHDIYQTSDGKVEGSMVLRSTCRMEQFVVDRDAGRVVAPSSCGTDGSVFVYAYPAGGAPLAHISGLNAPFATAISR